MEKTNPSGTPLEAKKKSFDMFANGDDLAFTALKTHAEESLRQQSQNEGFLGKTREAGLPTAPSRKTLFRLRYQKLKMILRTAAFVLLGFCLAELRFLFDDHQTSIFFPDYFAAETFEFIVDKEAVLKRGPKNSFESVGILEVGTLLPKMERIDRWYKVDFGKFIHSSQIQRLPKDRPWGWFEKVRVRNKQLKVFEAPHTKSKSIHTFTRGDLLEIRRVNSKWARLKSGGFVLYKKIFKRYGGPIYMKVKGKKAKVYAGPGYDYELIGHYVKDKIVKALISNKGWIKVGNNKYVNARDLKPIAKPTKVRNARSQP